MLPSPARDRFEREVFIARELIPTDAMAENIIQCSRGFHLFYLYLHSPFFHALVSIQFV